MESAVFNVKTEVFEGPLDLLLNLIEKRKLFINDISLAKVADDYIAYVNSLENYPTGDIANFILIASTLVLIKSKSLLPTLDLSSEEETSIQDLENRLKLYKRFKDLSIGIKDLFGKEMMFAKLPSKNIEPVFSPDEKISVQSLFQAVKEILNSLPKPEKLPQVVVRKIVSLEETIEKLTDRIKSNLKMSFKSFSGRNSAGPMSQEEKVNVIVSFLAMLELVKQGIIHAKQENLFEDIEMETKEVTTPSYI
jgi:segregation and condensation protein A